MDVKAAFHLTLRPNALFKLEEFLTWPVLCQFEAYDNQSTRKESIVQPDGFIRILEKSDAGLSDHSFFFELDRSSETLDTLVNRAQCYLDYYRSGGFAIKNGAERSQYKEFPFRVLMVLKTKERRNNFAERLLQSRPPILKQVYLTTFEEVISNPLGNIWVRPFDYREATKDTQFAPKEVVQKWNYKRQSERELFVEEKVQKQHLLNDNY